MGNSKIPRRKVLQGMALGGGLMMAGAACVPPTARLSPDTRPDPTKPEGTDTMPQVEHIIIYMQENHSYDNYFGMLGRGDGFTLDASGQPTNWNPGPDGNPVTVHKATVPNEAPHCSQNWNDTHDSVNGGAMDGFGPISPDSLKYYDGSFLPFYYGLATTFPICDRWFTSCQGQTHPNRRYLQAATSVGLVETDVAKVLATPDAPNGTIWDRLNQFGISWRDYVYDLPDLALFPRVLLSNQDKVLPVSQFLFDCASGRLPSVSMVSPGDTAFSEEPEMDTQLGEAYSAMLINAVLQSPLWPKTVMLFCYDEHGGFYDHVPPPAAIPPDNIRPQINVENGDRPGGFDRYGVRVPGFVISPFSKKDYVSHVVHDHTSILRFVETKWNLGAMTYRDANADNLMDSLDFTANAFAEPPTLPAPADPTGHSKFQSSPGLPGPTAGPHPAAPAVVS